MISNKFYLKFHLILSLYTGLIIKLLSSENQYINKSKLQWFIYYRFVFAIIFFFINYFKLLSVTYKGWIGKYSIRTNRRHFQNDDLNSKQNSFLFFTFLFEKYDLFLQQSSITILFYKFNKEQRTKWYFKKKKNK